MKTDHRSRFYKALGITEVPEQDEIFAWYFLICGPTCIGKSTFIGETGLYRTRSRPGVPEDFNLSKRKREKFINAGGHYEVAVNSHPKHWPAGLFSEDYIIKKGAILLGIPLEEWLKRIHKRGHDHVMKQKWRKLMGKERLIRQFRENIHKYEGIYTNQVTVLNTLNIPYIFVDNRKDYPILDESSFFTMLREEN
jgi:hypothetical protein